MRIDAQKQRPVNALLFAIGANGLRDCQDVPLVEGAMERGAAMARGSEGYALFGDFRIGAVRKVCGNQPGNVHQVRFLRRFTGIRVDRHCGLL